MDSQDLDKPIPDFQQPCAAVIHWRKLADIGVSGCKAVMVQHLLNRANIRASIVAFPGRCVAQGVDAKPAYIKVCLGCVLLEERIDVIVMQRFAGRAIGTTLPWVRRDKDVIVRRHRDQPARRFQVVLDQCPGTRRQLLRLDLPVLTLWFVAIYFSRPARSIALDDNSGFDVAPADSGYLVAPPSRPEIHAEQGAVSL